MAYHPLANDTGGTADDRRAEADRILKILEPINIKDINAREEEFLDNMYGNQTQPISPKQLFLLRDIKDEYL